MVRNKKLARNWTGPWIIVERLSGVLYKIKHSQNSKEVVIHADNIKRFNVRKTKANQLQRILRNFENNADEKIIEEPKLIVDTGTENLLPKQTKSSRPESRTVVRRDSIAQLPRQKFTSPITQQGGKPFCGEPLPKWGAVHSPRGAVEVKRTTRRGRTINVPSRYKH